MIYKVNSTSYFNYWGKASREDGSYHLLPYHCLDVAAVASVWWDESMPIQKSFMQHVRDLSVEQIKAWVIFFVALHDYGKFDIRFQRKATSAWEKLQQCLFGALALPTPADCKFYDHGSGGLYWFDRDTGTENPGDSDDWMSQIVDLVDEVDESSAAWLSWIKSVTGHHGFVYSSDHPVPDRHLHSTVSKQVAEQDKAARLAWLNELERLFLKPAGLSFEDTPPGPSPLLAGFCSVADWLGSRSDDVNFSYKSEHVDDLRTYLEQKCNEDAPRVLALAGINGASKLFSGVKALLNPEYQPRQLQTIVEDLPVGKIQPYIFKGIMQMTDASALNELMQHGIGPAKAFGCGLLSLASV